jgi:hypothetical protein
MNSLKEESNVVNETLMMERAVAKSFCSLIAFLSTSHHSPVMLFLKMNCVVSVTKAHASFIPASLSGTSLFPKAFIMRGTISSGCIDGDGAVTF